jgi:putative PIN family toxin of toxin-antitoxin system
VRHGRVFDTNVLFAAQFTNGVCAKLYEEALRDEPPITSEFILDELEEKLISKLHLSAAEARSIREEIASECRQVVVAPLEKGVCRDSDDDMILVTALAAEAECIVTGDKDLLSLERFEGIRIITPAQCLSELRGFE